MNALSYPPPKVIGLRRCWIKRKNRKEGIWWFELYGYYIAFFIENERKRELRFAQYFIMIEC